MNTWATSSVAAGADALARASRSPPSGLEVTTPYTSRAVSPSSAEPGSSYPTGLIVSVRPRTAAMTAWARWSPSTTPTGTSRGVGLCSAPT
ncbi:hypothetical protein [Micromonospora sp. NPDC048830]|uniref:hypothetical protein n=1 Tax=Micromonospora sp. NPDC048830 TaxID=3364257 RepID=UPI00371274F1